MKEPALVIQRLEEFIRKKMEGDAIPGLSVAVTDKGKDLYSGTFGVSESSSGDAVVEKTLFQIGSVSKSFTSIVLLQLQERGKLDVHAPVTEYLPWFQVRSRHAPITLHHLMTHTAGIPIGSDATVMPDSEVWNLRHLEASTPPGERFHYSNTGYKTLGLVIEEVSGATYAEAISAGILHPLDMDDTEPVITNSIRARTAVGYTWFHDDRPPARNAPLAPATWFESNTGDGCISSTARDMAKYLRMLLNGGAGPNGRIVSEKSFELLTSRYVFCGEDGRDEHYGYGLSVLEDGGTTVLAHTGGMVGYTCSMAANMQDGLGAIVLTNSHGQPEQVTDYFLEILRADRAGKALPQVVLTAQRHTPKAPSEYVGVYSGDGGTIEVRERDSALFAVVGGDEVLMEGFKDDLFLVDHPDLALFLMGFTRADGKVVSAFHGGNEYFLRGEDEDEVRKSIPEPYEAFVGHYRSHNPWLTNFRVVCRNGQLIFVEPTGREQVLVPTGDRSFREGVPGSPETLEFDMLVNGRALMAVYSGGPFHRTFTP
ncbi:TPA: serine hydrolase [Thermoplasmata archaeon]|nr:serine hydrolase [Thermoplasmata archaeon]